MQERHTAVILAETTPSHQRWDDNYLQHSLRQLTAAEFAATYFGSRNEFHIFKLKTVQDHD